MRYPLVRCMRSAHLRILGELAPTRLFDHGVLGGLPIFLQKDAVAPPWYLCRRFAAASPRKFEQLSLHPQTMKAIRKKGLVDTTEVQDKTYDCIREGGNVIARASTGQGKTLAFLLPSLERVLFGGEARKSLGTNGSVRILVLAPTRELVAQITEEVRTLLRFHDNRIMTCQSLQGGSSRSRDLAKFQKCIPSVIVATPGRLLDHLKYTVLNGTKFSNYLSDIQCLIVDETDRMLDMGLREDLQSILDVLPGHRQTLLFSATFPPSLWPHVDYLAGKDAHVVDCTKGPQMMPTVSNGTRQSYAIIPTERFLSGTVGVLLRLIDDPKNKVIVFFPTISMVQFFSKLVTHSFGRRVNEIHSKLPPRMRSVVSQRFRQKRNGVCLFTSDVSARGLDYPDVTHVVQVGAPKTQETYVHRLGRTGRAGKEGVGILLLPEFESHFVSTLEGFDVFVDMALQDDLRSLQSKNLVDQIGVVANRVRCGQDDQLARAAANAYQSMLNYYLGSTRGSKDANAWLDKIVDTVNSFAFHIGLKELPAVGIHRAKKLGIEHLGHKINIARGWQDTKDWSERWG